MHESQAIIERVRQINAQYQQLELAVADPGLAAGKPGQALLVRPAPDRHGRVRWDPYLRELWWPMGQTPSGTLLIERPLTIPYEPQQILTALGPLGHPFRFRQDLRNVLLVAYDTPPLPLTSMIQRLLHHQISVTLVLIGSARQYATDHLPPQVEVLQGDDLDSWPDRVMTLGWADQIFVVVRQDDELLRFSEVLQITRQHRTRLPANYIFGVFQPWQPCGVGACGACMLRVGTDLVTACTDGPAFDLTKVKLPV